MGVIRYSEEHRRRISEGVKRCFQSPAYRKRHSQRTREAVNVPEVKERHRQAMRDAWARRKAAAEKAEHQGETSNAVSS